MKIIFVPKYGLIINEDIRRINAFNLEKIQEEAGDKFPDLIHYGVLDFLLNMKFEYSAKWN